MFIELYTHQVTAKTISVPMENPVLLERLKPFSRANIREFVTHQARMLAISGCDRILDVGCGYRTNEPEVTGEFETSQAKPQYVAFDNTAQFDKRVDPNAKLNLVAAATQMPFQDCQFDAALCTEVLEHAYNDEAVLREIGRVIKAGGRLILTVPGKDVPLHEKLPYQYDYRRYNQTALKLLLAECGFSDISVKSGEYNGLEINLLVTATKISG